MSRERAPGRRSAAWWIVLLVLLWALPVIATGVFWTLARDAEKDGLAAPSPSAVVVGERVDDERREAVAEVQLGIAQEAVAGRAGIVTAVLVSAGTALNNGTELVRIDGSTIVAYAEDEPLYRPLQSSAQGPDVLALGTFLSGLRLLDESSVDDRFGPRMDAAVRDYQKKYGFPVTGTFEPSYVSFVEGSFVADEPAVRLGQAVTEGGPLVASQAPAEKVSLLSTDLTSLPPFSSTDLTLTAGPESIPLTGTELTGDTAQVALAALRGTGPGVTTEEGLVRYSGVYIALATPIQRGAAPAPAVYVASGGTACLFSYDGAGVRAIPLEDASMAASEIGVALVPGSLVGTEVVSDVSALTAEDRASCG